MKRGLNRMVLLGLLAVSAPGLAADPAGRTLGKKVVERQPLNTDPEPDLADPGFVSLFDGKTLTGWTPRQGTMQFDVVDGAIRGTCGPGPSTFLCTDQTFSDFILTWEFKWDVDGNSGVQIRSRLREGKDHDIVFGPQVEMEDLAKNGRGWSGGIYGQACGGWLYRLSAPEHQVLKDVIDRSGWNRLTVKADGNVVQTWINGRPAAQWVDAKNEYPSGFIGLQVHSGKQGVIRWRNLNIRTL